MAMEGSETGDVELTPVAVRATKHKQTVSRKSAKGRTLVRWDVDKDQQVLLAIEAVVVEMGVELDWNRVARLLLAVGLGTPENPVTGEALKQHFYKVRRARDDYDLLSPPKAEGKSAFGTRRGSANGSGRKSRAKPAKANGDGEDVDGTPAAKSRAKPSHPEYDSDDDSDESDDGAPVKKGSKVKGLSLLDPRAVTAKQNEKKAGGKLIIKLRPQKRKVKDEDDYEEDIPLPRPQKKQATLEQIAALSKPSMVDEEDTKPPQPTPKKRSHKAKVPQTPKTVKEDESVQTTIASTTSANGVDVPSKRGRGRPKKTGSNFNFEDYLRNLKKRESEAGSSIKNSVTPETPKNNATSNISATPNRPKKAAKPKLEKTVSSEAQPLYTQRSTRDKSDRPNYADNSNDVFGGSEISEEAHTKRSKEDDYRPKKKLTVVEFNKTLRSGVDASEVTGKKPAGKKPAGKKPVPPPSSKPAPSADSQVFLNSNSEIQEHGLLPMAEQQSFSGRLNSLVGNPAPMFGSNPFKPQQDLPTFSGKTLPPSNQMVNHKQDFPPAFGPMSSSTQGGDHTAQLNFQSGFGAPGFGASMLPHNQVVQQTANQNLPMPEPQYNLSKFDGPAVHGPDTVSTGFRADRLTFGSDSAFDMHPANNDFFSIGPSSDQDFFQQKGQGEAGDHLFGEPTQNNQGDTGHVFGDPHLFGNPNQNDFHPRNEGGAGSFPLNDINEGNYEAHGDLTMGINANQNGSIFNDVGEGEGEGESDWRNMSFTSHFGDATHFNDGFFD